MKKYLNSVKSSPRYGISNTPNLDLPIKKQKKKAVVVNKRRSMENIQPILDFKYIGNKSKNTDINKVMIPTTQSQILNEEFEFSPRSVL